MSPTTPRKRFAMGALSIILIGTPVLGCNRTFDGTGVPGGYLTVDDVQRGTGVPGMRVSKDTSGTFQFMDGSGQLLVEARLGTDRDYQRWRLVPGASRAPMTGLGEDAYQGPVSGSMPNVIAFMKGDHAIQLTTPQTATGYALTFDQLYGLASVAAGRL